jgi:hypothetical protein
MSGDEDEAGAVHDNAGEVHSDGPGGVSEAGVMHAPVPNLGDILRAARHGRGRRQSGDLDGGTATCAATRTAPRALRTIWRVPAAMCATRGHARRVGQTPESGRVKD